jgi:hypothetical protein
MKEIYTNCLSKICEVSCTQRVFELDEDLVTLNKTQNILSFE